MIQEPGDLDKLLAMWLDGLEKKNQKPSENAAFWKWGRVGQGLSFDSLTCLWAVGQKSIYISASFADDDDVQNKSMRWCRGARWGAECSASSVSEELLSRFLFRKADSDRFTPRPGRRRQPAVWTASRGLRAAPCRCGRRSLVYASSSHSTACAGSAAQSSPPPTRHQGRPAKQTKLNMRSLGPGMLVINLRKHLSSHSSIVMLRPVCLQRWAEGRPAAPSPSAVWPAHCEPPSDGLCGSCPPQTPPLHEEQGNKKH